MLRYLLLGISIAASLAVQAQDIRKAFLRISADDGLGLSSNVVSALHQDDKGFIWVGTSSGIQRFDGSKFVTYDTRKPGSKKLPEGAVRQMIGDLEGRIWILMDRGGDVGIFDPTAITYKQVKVTTSRPPPPRAEYSIWRDSKGDMYLNILRYGKILKFDNQRFEFNENTPLNLLPAGWKAQASIFEDTVTQRYWIVADKGLCIYDEKSRRMWSAVYNPENIPILNDNAPERQPTEFFIDRNRRHWYFYWTHTQIFTCFNENGEYLPDTAGLKSENPNYSELRKFLNTRNGSLWIYGPGGLHVQDSSQSRFRFFRSQYTDNFNIRYNNVNDIIEDRDGVIWIATDQGLYYYIGARRQVNNYYLSEQPGYYTVTDLIQLKTGQYWISTWGRGILSIRDTDDDYNPELYAGMPAGQPKMFMQVWAMMQHSSGKIYLGCQAGRMMIHDPVTKKTQFLNPPEFEERTLRYFAEDKKGRVWIGTQNGTVFRYDGIKFEKIYALEETSMIYKLMVDKTDDLIWVCSHERGLYALDIETGQQKAHYASDDKAGNLFGNRISDIEQLNDSILYVAASGVIHIINKNTGKAKRLTTEEGLPSNTASHIRLDAKGYLWIVTNNGLCHYDWRKNKFTSFGKKDGFFLGELVDKCDLLDQNNNVLFAGQNSLMSFNPDLFYNNPPPPPVVITDFKLLNTYLPVDSLTALPNIRMEPGENSITINFSTLSYRNRGQISYYYKLEGFDKDWVRADATQSAPYRQIPHGKYTFKVKAENLDGIATESITTLSIVVKPQFWQTGWFYTSLLTVLAMIGYGMHRLRLTKALAVEKIRARVSRDLHDDMGSTLSTINILSSMAKAKLTTDCNKTAEYISKIGDNSQRMMEAMDDIVWAIKPDNDTMQKLIARMREFATNVLEAKDIKIDFKADEQINELKPDMEMRRDFFLLFKEAVNNAAKYSKGTEVLISVEMVHQKIKLMIADNGVGFDIHSADSGNGLGNMQRRATTLRGQLQIRSEAGKGTRVTLHAPLTTN